MSKLKRKPKIVCPVCNLVVALKPSNNGALVLPRHRRRWRAHETDSRICPASERTQEEAERQAVESQPAPYTGPIYDFPTPTRTAFGDRGD